MIEIKNPDLQVRQYDVVIVGAGPAGTACAMSLKGSGLNVALIDKYSFPRDKICGDFVMARAMRELYKIEPLLKQRFTALEEKTINKSTKFFVNSHNPIHFDWVLRSYTVRREIFDNILLETVLDHGEVDFLPNTLLKTIRYVEDGLQLECASGSAINCKLIIGADGAQSIVAKSLAGFKIDKRHYGGAVRAYFKNVKNIKPDTTEVYVSKGFSPGYFWLFPTSENEANVGFGMISKDIAKGKINLKHALKGFIDNHEALSSKLSDAVMDDRIEGFGLPFYSQKVKASGDRFMLCGDAASLIDPMNGEGILQAIVSGRMAAEHAIKCFEKQEFGEEMTLAYEYRVHKKYWKEMRNKALAIKLFANKIRFLQSGAWLINRSKPLHTLIRKLM